MLIAACPSNGDWKFIQGTCYSFVKTKLIYTDARTYCKGMGGKLLEPKDEITNDVIKDVAIHHLDGPWETIVTWGWFWLGIDDIDQEGEFKYASDMSPILWSNWNLNQPDNKTYNSTDEDCAVMMGPTAQGIHEP